MAASIHDKDRLYKRKEFKNLGQIFSASGQAWVQETENLRIYELIHPQEWKELIWQIETKGNKSKAIVITSSSKETQQHNTWSRHNTWS